jgi:hypothetical protein
MHKKTNKTKHHSLILCRQLSTRLHYTSVYSRQYDKEEEIPKKIKKETEHTTIVGGKDIIHQDIKIEVAITQAEKESTIN